MGGTLFMLLWSVAMGGYSMALLKTSKSKLARLCLWGSMVSNGVAALILSAVLAGALHG